MYDAILEASIRNTARLGTILTDSVSEMDDAGRLAAMNDADVEIRRNETALRSFTQQNTLLSLQRAKDEADIHAIKTLYGIQ